MPFAFLLLQIPELSTDWLMAWLHVKDQSVTFAKLVLLLPYICVTSTLTSSLTCALVIERDREASGALGRALRLVGSRLGSLIPVSLLSGCIVLLGVAAAVLPGLYFMTLFLFVPQLLVTENRLPWSVYLSRSKRLAKKQLRRNLVLVLVIMGVLASATAVSDHFQDLAEHSASLGLSSPAVVWTIEALLTLVLTAAGALVDVWISYYFLHVQKDGGP